MKAAVILSLVAVALGSAFEKRACAGNNCNRQVTGTRPGLPAMSLRMADCSSFQATTVTPEEYTTTVTVTVDPEEPVKFKYRRDAALEMRQMTVVPSDIPAYADSCDNSSEYASACGCAGVTPTVVEAETPTVTSTITVTADYCEEL